MRWLLLCGLMLSGCLQPLSTELRGTDASFESQQARHTVVVAYLDRGINPYHAAFQRSIEAVDIAAVTGGSATPVTLSAGQDYAKNVENDRLLWAGLEREKLYWFRGTNILGISFEPPPPKGLWDDAIRDTGGHGTAIASVVARSDSDALLLAVQVAGLGGNATDGYLPPWLLRAVEWVAAQSWIDIVFASIGGIGGIDPPTFDAFSRATHGLATNGKPVVMAAGNTPTIQWTGNWNGPPWVIAAGGVENTTHGSDFVASRQPDVVSVFTSMTALHDSTDAYDWGSGTSYASPLVAATLSKTLHALRERYAWPEHNTTHGLATSRSGIVDAVRLRAALNATAVYWNTTDWGPNNYPNGADLVTRLYATNLPVSPTPWIDMGWGYLHPDLSDRIVDVLEGGKPPEKPDAAKLYMEQVYAARTAYWDARLGHGDEP